MTSTAILIPARYGSTRFVGKPLTLLDGVPMVKRVYDKCAATGHDTYVLTDDYAIAQLFDDNTCRIDNTDYQNGTERCAGTISLVRKYDQYINVQGDMPDVTPNMIQKLQSSKHELATLFTTMPINLQKDTNAVKLVKAGDQAIDFVRGIPAIGYGHHHLGVYKFSRRVLSNYLNLQVPPEEKSQGLEQLRWLRSGYNIGCVYTDFDGIEINTHDDVRRWHDNRG